MKVFGPGWADRTWERVSVPVGWICLHCDEAIASNDHGFIVPYINEHGIASQKGQHRECFLRSIIGSVAHQQKRCTCFGGSEEDDPKLSKREAARRAVLLWESKIR